MIYVSGYENTEKCWCILTLQKPRFTFRKFKSTQEPAANCEEAQVSSRNVGFSSSVCLDNILIQVSLR